MLITGCAISLALRGSPIRPGGVRFPFSAESACVGAWVGARSDPIEGIVVALLRETNGGGPEEELVGLSC
jgi:hypothetical protein